ELYRQRWEADKVFDEIKNKLGQKKAWGTTLEAKETQALLIAITHNLLLCYEQDLERRYQLENTAEDQRRRRQTETAKRRGVKIGCRQMGLAGCFTRSQARSDECALGFGLPLESAAWPLAASVRLFNPFSIHSADPRAKYRSYCFADVLPA
ncbi:MAG TPA: hypothetical protein VMV89_00205, partial [Candidatus Paceibacterota bacterium]|nr:hypothetical protein [Candidatus Paceibacterota bacterium]